jgi:pyruvate,water dikinase
MGAERRAAVSAGGGEKPRGEVRSDRFVLEFQEIDRRLAAVVGAKGAHLGELSRIEGIEVPPGFCVTTDAYRLAIAAAASMEDLLERLTAVRPGDGETIRRLSAEIRGVVEGAPIEEEVAAAVTHALARGGEHLGYAVRSSSTAEDLVSSSFAGQHDTYLNVVGAAEVLEHVRRCWASLFAERAVAYRVRSGFDHRDVHMAVVVQRMLAPQAAGVLFTADPITSNRTVASVEASFGLGEALVSGAVNADVFSVRDGELLAKRIASKRFAIEASPAGGTRQRAIEPSRAEQPALTDDQVVALAQLGRRVEAHFGSPQDIEWCLDDGAFAIVQSRPITTLFPVPVASDRERHVYISVGHQQMMTDPMKPLGLSLFQLTALRPMYEAGGRLFVDVAQDLASPATRAVLLALWRSDPLIGGALEAVIERGDLLPPADEEGRGGVPPREAPAPLDPDPTIVGELIERSEASIAGLERDIRTHAGPALLDFILADVQELKRLLVDPQSNRVIMASMNATWWLNEQLEKWLGEKNAADPLTQSVPDNITSQMGLDLLEVADAVRPHPQVIAALEHVGEEDRLDALAAVPGGAQAREAIDSYLDKYGMRCVGEIDITRPRWSERPGTLAPAILSNVGNFEAGAAGRRFEQGRREAAEKEQELLGRLRALPGGQQKADEAKLMIDRVRTFAGYREYPKYGIVGRYFVYKRALLREADRLVEAGAIREREDIFFLTLQELRDVARTHEADDALISRRKQAFMSYRALDPPRVLTSEGEVFTGSYRREDLPAGALVGLAVSGGTVEGRARVVLDMAEAELEPGDILVTAYTDPSWSPVFLAVDGLVTEVGGLMTHGAVIAREYGLPAVVGVQHATRLITDGQRIRVNGTEGYVEILG